QPGQVGDVGDQADLDQRLRQKREDPADVVVAVQRQGDEDVRDLVLADQFGQVGEVAHHVQVAAHPGGALLDEPHVLDPQPAHLVQGGSQPAGAAAGADDDAEGLVVAPAAPGVDQRPAGPAGEQDAGGGQGGEQEHGGPRLVAVVQEEQGRHDEQGEQRGPLEDGDDLLAQPPQAGDLVLAGDPEGAGGQQQ